MLLSVHNKLNVLIVVLCFVAVFSLETWSASRAWDLAISYAPGICLYAREIQECCNVLSSHPMYGN